jgi:hypothetical protein
MATKTLLQLRDIVRFRGTFENSAKFTDARVDVEINAAAAELHELLADSNEGYLDTTATVATVAAQDYVALPADFWRLRGVDILIGGRYCELDQVGINDRNKFQVSSGRPEAYRVAAGSTRGRLILYPTPNAIETIRVVYTPTVTALTLDADTVEGFNEWHDLIIAGTLLRLFQREERPLGEIQQEIARLQQRIRSAAGQRRAAEPELIPLGRGDHLYDLEWWL